MNANATSGKEDHGEEPWHDGEKLERLYHEKGLSAHELAERWGCHHGTVLYQMEKNDIERRPASKSGGRPPVQYAGFGTKPDGYEVWSAWNSEKETVEQVRVHRLLAVAQFGFEAVCGNVVHHGGGPEHSTTPWDNRPGNLQLLPRDEHTALHESIRSGYYAGGWR